MPSSHRESSVAVVRLHPSWDILCQDVDILLVNFPFVDMHYRLNPSRLSTSSPWSVTAMSSVPQAQSQPSVHVQLLVSYDKDSLQEGETSCN
ncbi:hypothetical protein PoB_004623300 [Plakobranchus ocellatus]|uniref:Uncharacterized protein n=1 Tax=Plakobranchus ocellatus TaxID=259542 RepID=A0AAV4BKP6_9GAST|nr:hypothetical protein PoB_004623300 [Plakobranchus ocellatus]